MVGPHSTHVRTSKCLAIELLYVATSPGVGCPQPEQVRGPRIVERSTRGADWVDVVEAGWTEPHDRGEERTRRTKTTTWQR